MIIYTNKHKIPFEIDDTDLEVVSQYSWSISSGGYVKTGIWPGTTAFLHQVLLGNAPDGFIWDHIDRNKMNNHRNNFRLLTPSESQENRDSKSNLVGIRVCNGGWQSWIPRSKSPTGNPIYLGTSKSLEEAIHIQNSAIRVLQGEQSCF